jgi:hypothetical protein
MGMENKINAVEMAKILKSIFVFSSRFEPIVLVSK